MKKIITLGFLVSLVSLTGCAYQPLEDRTYLPNPNSAYIQSTPQQNNTIYYNSRGEAYQPNSQGQMQKIPEPVYESPKALRMNNNSIQQAPIHYTTVQNYYYPQQQPVYQQVAPVYYAPQPVYGQRYVQQVYPQPVYQTRANVGGAIMGGAVGAVLGNELTRNRYYVPRHRGYGGYYRNASHGNLAVVGLGAAVGSMAGSGCQTNGGTVIGALIGGAIGQSIGGGSGRAVATAIGAGSGAIIGSGC